MDPDAARNICVDRSGIVLSEKCSEEDAVELAEAFDGLDEWICKGGFLPKAWADEANGGIIKRVFQAIQVYDELYNATETFEEDGEHIAYLLGAILKDNQIEVDPTGAEEDFYSLLKNTFSEDHEVWHYIELVS